MHMKKGHDLKRKSTRISSFPLDRPININRNVKAVAVAVAVALVPVEFVILSRLLVVILLALSKRTDPQFFGVLK